MNLTSYYMEYKTVLLGPQHMKSDLQMIYKNCDQIWENEYSSHIQFFNFGTS